MNEGPLTVLSVAYPFSAVGVDGTGGAEQVLVLVDRALVLAGHRSIVIAHEASEILGTLVPIADPGARVDAAAALRTHAAVRDALDRTVRAFPIDVVHAHGIDFDRYVDPDTQGLAVTLHLPVAWYARDALACPGARLACVSEAQGSDMPSWAAPWRVIENGVALDAFAPARVKGRFCVWLGRICEEKAVHEALDAATAAGVPLIVAGPVGPWDAHRRYFERYVAPRLRAPHRWIGPIALRPKRRLLAAARCLLVTSRARETSSLVAMEAAASGTAVIAYPSGALASVVEHGRTGFLVDGAAAMARAIAKASDVSAPLCREVAEARFSARRMTDAYLALYREIARSGAPRARACAADLAVEEVSGVDALAAIADEWTALWARCPWATPFQRPEWLVAYASAFSVANGARPWALAARRAGRLVGLLPLSTRAHEGARATSLLGAGISDYLDVIATADERDAAAARLVEALGPACAGDDEVWLDPLRPCSPLLAAPAPRGAGEEGHARDPSPVLSFVGRASPIPKAMRRDLRCDRRRAAALGAIDLAEAKSQRDVTAWLDDVFRLHEARWVERGERGVFAEPAVRRFYREAVAGLAGAGLACVYGLRIGGRVAAAILALRDARAVYCHIGGFDPGLAAASPGTILIGYAVERALQGGVAELDFLRGRERYKYLFGAEDRPARARRFYAQRAPCR